MSSDAKCNNDTSQDEEEYDNHNENFAKQLKSKLPYANNRQKSSARNPFSSSGYVRRRRRKRNGKKLGTSGLAKEAFVSANKTEKEAFQTKSSKLEEEKSN